jgi:hypothetical protein
MENQELSTCFLSFLKDARLILALKSLIETYLAIIGTETLILISNTQTAIKTAYDAIQCNAADVSQWLVLFEKTFIWTLYENMDC